MQWKSRSRDTIPEEVIKPWKLPPQRTYVFTNAHVVDSEKGVILSGQTVKLSDGKITSLRSSRSYIEIEDEAIIIDLQGKYLSPGLIDCHVHLTSVPGESDLRSSMTLSQDVSLMRQPFVCKAMLERGYTTVRDCGGASLALKEAIADGVFPGPRLFIAGHALSQTGGHGDKRGAHEKASQGCCGGSAEGLSVVCDGVPECLRGARDQLRTGADFIKLMVGGGVASPTDALENTQFTAEEIRAVAEVADTYDTIVTAHAYTPKAIRRAVENGVRGIEHGNLIDKETAAFMAEKGVFLTPTLVTYQAMADPKYAAFLPVENQKKNEQVLQQGLVSVKLAHEAGVTMCLGSDLLSFLGVEQLKEFGLRAQVLGNADVLRHATVNPARLLRQKSLLGQIKEGFLADILILNENPLEDITVFERPEKHLLAVIKEGRVYSSRWSKLAEDTSVRTAVLE